MEPDDERIRQRAYAIWLEEGSPEGRAEEHWELARRLLREETATRQDGNDKTTAGKTAPKAKS